MLPTQHPVRMALLFSILKTNFLQDCNFYTNISNRFRSATKMLSVQDLHQIFPDEIDCVKFISICQATKEKIYCLTVKDRQVVSMIF